MKKGNKLNKALSIISKIMEIAHWIAAGFSALLALVSLLDKEFVNEVVADGGAELVCYGFEMNVLTQTGEINYFAVTMAFIGMIFSCSLMALIFRNLDIILTTIMGKYKRAKSSSPFQKDVVKRVRKIGFFAIAMPVVGLIFSAVITIVSLISGISTDVVVSFDGVIIGLICICLSQIFAYGTSLEEEVDGLL